MRVLIICEDPTHDQFVVKPVVQEIFERLERPVRLDVLTDPHLGGVDDVLAQLEEIVADNRMIDLFLVIVDRDCDRQGNSRRIADAVAGLPKAVACLAIEEVEIWMLCIHRALLPPWTKVRADCDVKEHHAIPLLTQLGLDGPGQGRKAAMRNLGREWRSLLQLCPEVQALADQVRSSLAGD